jgi:hypothetical protein
MRIKPHLSGYGIAVGTAARTLQRVGDSEWVERLGRIGLVAKGVSFLIVGVLALLVAFGAGGAATDRPGAFRLLSEQSYGFVALLAIALGFGAYALWRFAQAFLDRDDEGNDMEGWAKRAGCLVKGLFYGGLSLLAISFLTGPRGESESERERTAQVFEWPLGRWLVGALGVALFAYGLFNGYRSISGKFRKHLEEGKIHRENVSPLVKRRRLSRPRSADGALRHGRRVPRPRGLAVRPQGGARARRGARQAGAPAGRPDLARRLRGRPLRLRCLQPAAGALPRHLKLK